MSGRYLLDTNIITALFSNEPNAGEQSKAAGQDRYTADSLSCESDRPISTASQKDNRPIAVKRVEGRAIV